MSKFLSIIEASVPGNKDTTTAVVSAINKKPDSDLSPAEKEVKSAYINMMNKVKADLAATVKEEEETDEVAQEPTPGENTTTLSPEGEVFYVDLMKKALFVDLDNIELNNTEKEVVTNDVTPTNAKQVAEVIRKIINDFGLGV
tara:strand:+ start:1594 stop:2022 length:429 start_codon:yes stop_codon:yes gene_type:complete